MRETFGRPQGHGQETVTQQGCPLSCPTWTHAHTARKNRLPCTRTPGYHLSHLPPPALPGGTMLLPGGTHPCLPCGVVRRGSATASPAAASSASAPSAPG